MPNAKAVTTLHRFAVDELDQACATLAGIVATDGPYRVTKTEQWIELSSSEPLPAPVGPECARLLQRAQWILNSMTNSAQPTHWVRPFRDRTPLLWTTAV